MMQVFPPLESIKNIDILTGIKREESDERVLKQFKAIVHHCRFLFPISYIWKTVQECFTFYLLVTISKTVWKMNHMLYFQSNNISNCSENVQQ